MKNYSEIKECLTNNDVVKELIMNNPDLPLIFLCGEDCWTDECGYLVNSGRAQIEELAVYNERLMERDDLEDKLNDVMINGNESLSDEEYSKLVADELSKYEFRKAITIRLG